VSFEFDERTHAYTHNGVCVPSVTRTLDMAGLVSFDAVRKDILERKSEIGTMVHLATHYYDEGVLDWDSVNEDCKGRIEAWANFRADTGFVPRIIEVPFLASMNGMTFGLKPDRIGVFGKAEAIIDLKTSASVEDWVGVQTAGYALGVPDIEGSSPLERFYRRRRISVQLFEDGRYKKRDFTDRGDATVFLSALHITTWKMNHGSALRKIQEAA
jgi:hypothetical protein